MNLGMFALPFPTFHIPSIFIFFNSFSLKISQVTFFLFDILFAYFASSAGVKISGCSLTKSLVIFTPSITFLLLFNILVKVEFDILFEIIVILISFKFDFLLLYLSK